MLQRTNTTTNSFFSQYNQDATTNTDATSNAEEYYRPMSHARAHDVSGIHALIRASVFTFVIFCKYQFSVYFSYPFICAFSSEIFFMLYMCVRLFMLFIRERLFIVFTKQRFFMLFKFTCAVNKS